MSNRLPSQEQTVGWRLAGAVLACSTGLLVAGCGRGADLPPMARVSGNVMLDGQPLTRGTVQFVPDKGRGTQGPPAVGGIDEEGQFELETAGVRGALVGFHKIRIESRRPPRDETDTWPPSLIPARYENPVSSGLTAEVKADEKNVIDLQLSSK